MVLSACTTGTATTVEPSTVPTSSTPLTPNTVVTTTSTSATMDTTTSTAPSDDGEACQRDGNTMLVDASCFERDWPFTVEEGTLAYHTVTFMTDDALYALNGLALTRELGVDPDPIWLDNPDVEGFKVSIGPLIDLGLTLCG